MTSERHRDVVIVGAGQGGGQAAMALRQRKFAGSIAIIGDEPDLPYERPPLSKDYLAGQRTAERLLLRPPAYWEERGIEMRLGRRVVNVDAEARSIETDRGDVVEYSTLIWAAGGAARRLSCVGAELAGVHVVRSRADVDTLRDDLSRAARIVIVGGGYIGLEVAAVLTKLGKRVVVLEAQDRLLARVCGTPISSFFEAEHRSHGVDVRLGVQVERLTGAHGRVGGVCFAGGGSVPADLVIVGIGIDPNVSPLLRAGAAGVNGVDVDRFCKTSLPNVYAIGDCASHPNAYAGGDMVRLESVQNANDQAAAVAQTLSGAPTSYESVPWFWSHQYDLHMQSVGLSRGHDDMVVRGDPAAKTFSVIYLRHGRVIAIDCINTTKDYAQGRGLIVSGASPQRDLLSDAQIPLKTLAQASPG